MDRHIFVGYRSIFVSASTKKMEEVERDVDTLENFVEQLCLEPPGPPGSQRMDIINAEHPSELGLILHQIWFNLFRILQGNESLMEQYMLSLGVRCRFFRRDEAPNNNNLVPVIIPWFGNRILRFEIDRFFVAS